MQKKGEMTTQQIVLLVILIVSFVIILILLMRLQFGEESDSELCRNSVVTRGSAVVPSDAVPLDCRRQYVCITKDNTCESMTNPQKIKVSNKEEVYFALAKQLSDCWWMYGEGKVNYVGKDMLPNMYCSMCSQIAFDNSVKEIFGGNTFNKEEFMRYLTLTNMSGSSSTYSFYLYKTNNLNEIYNGSFGAIDLDKQYYSLTAITSKISNVGWIAAGAAVGAGAVVTFVTGGTAGAVFGAIIGGTAAGIGYEFLAPVVEGDSGNDFVVPSLIEANSEQFKGLQCDEISTAG